VRAEEADTVLVELGLVEQRYRAVLEILNDGATVVEVARRYGVARQTLHAWLRRYAVAGLGGLADRSSRPASCQHQIHHLRWRRGSWRCGGRIRAGATQHPDPAWP
jgi:transposase-like protein